MIDVLLVDDHALVRARLRAILEKAGDSQVAAGAENRRVALCQARQHRPGVILMDQQMPGMGGLATIEAVRTDPLVGRIPVLVLTIFDDEEEFISAIAAASTATC